MGTSRNEVGWAEPRRSALLAGVVAILTTASLGGWFYLDTELMPVAPASVAKATVEAGFVPHAQRASHLFWGASTDETKARSLAPLAVPASHIERETAWLQTLVIVMPEGVKQPRDLFDPSDTQSPCYRET